MKATRTTRNTPAGLLTNAPALSGDIHPRRGDTAKVREAKRREAIKRHPSNNPKRYGRVVGVRLKPDEQKALQDLRDYMPGSGYIYGDAGLIHGVIALAARQHLDRQLIGGTEYQVGKGFKVREDDE